MSASTHSISQHDGGTIVDIECRLSNNLPNIVIVGSANKAVGESRERIRGAFADSRIMLPRKRITVNLAPADIPKADSGFDVAIAVSIMLAAKHVPPLSSQQVFIGELGLNGRTRPVRGIIGKLLTGRLHGLTTFYIPAANLRQAKLVPHITLLPVQDLRQLFEHLAGMRVIPPINTASGSLPAPPSPTVHSGPSLHDVVGQQQAKRALIIAAAGGHNVLLSGPPGTGKSMLAKALPSVLPPLSREEMLEVTHLHSLASPNYDQLVTYRPVRAPHHSASRTAITGGGAQAKPGEISLAHHGVLLLDELPEFGRDTVEMLRQPLEDRTIRVSRVGGSIVYPANFMLVATANPCPCGYWGSPTGSCRCQQAHMLRYRRRLSGPILDRFDLFCEVHEVQHGKLLAQTDTGNTEETKAREQVMAARQQQHQRFGDEVRLNADMTNSELQRHGRLDAAGERLLNSAARTMKLSARAYLRVVKVARTIADLEESPHISREHLSEALAYRQPMESLPDT